MMGEVELELIGLSKSYGNDRVLDDVSLAINAGEMVTVLGQSGSGKTTMLRCIAGFLVPNSGDIRVRGRSIVSLPVNRRGIGIVFQNYALFPHMTVAENVAYGLRVQRVPRNEIKTRVQEELERVELIPYSHRRPAQLSGGQQQRTAVARALVLRPPIVLFDEPLSNLDAMLRDSLREELKGLQQRLRFTAMFVTHDQREAMSLGDRVAVMEAGHLRQIGTPIELYERPAYRSIAELLGKANIFECRQHVSSGGVRHLDWNGIPLQTSDTIPTDESPVIAMVRPEKVRLSLQDDPSVDLGVDRSVKPISGEIEDISYQGARSILKVRVANRGLLLVDVHSEGDPREMRIGTRVAVLIRASDVRVISSR